MLYHIHTYIAGAATHFVRLHRIYRIQILQNTKYTEINITKEFRIFCSCKTLQLENKTTATNV